MSEFIEIGKIINTHGLHGELKIAPWCDGIKVFQHLDKVFINNTEYSLVSAREHKNCFLAVVLGIDTIEKAEKLKNKTILARTSDMPPLEENFFYIRDIIGLSVYDSGELIGKVTDCFSTGSNDVYVVKGDDGRDVLVPALKQVVKNISIEDGRMDIEMPEGLDVYED